MVVQKTKMFGASKVAKTLLSHNNVFIAKTAEPVRQRFDSEHNIRVSRGADEQQTSHQLTVGKQRRVSTRLGAVILSEMNSSRHGSILRLTVFKVKPVLELGDVGTLEQGNRAVRVKVNIHTQHTGGVPNILHLKLTKGSRAAPLKVGVNIHYNQVINLDANKENNNFTNHAHEQVSINRTSG